LRYTTYQCEPSAANPAGVIPDETNEGCILGHVGGLQFFAALVDGEQEELTLTANAQLPAN
jgi:hypothetical protein